MSTTAASLRRSGGSRMSCTIKIINYTVRTVFRPLAVLVFFYFFLMRSVDCRNRSLKKTDIFKKTVKTKLRNPYKSVGYIYIYTLDEALLVVPALLNSKEARPRWYGHPRVSAVCTHESLPYVPCYLLQALACMDRSPACLDIWFLADSLRSIAYCHAFLPCYFLSRWC
jgi:hypothetical protein